MVESEGSCIDDLTVYDTRGKTCDAYNDTPELCGVYDTFGPKCEEYESDARGCIGNFTASESCCACGGQKNRFFCCNYVDWGESQSSCDLLEGGSIVHQDFEEYSYDSVTYVLNFEEGKLKNKTSDDEVCSNLMEFGGENLISIIAPPVLYTIITDLAMFGTWFIWDYLLKQLFCDECREATLDTF